MVVCAHHYVRGQRHAITHLGIHAFTRPTSSRTVASHLVCLSVSYIIFFVLAENTSELYT